IRSWATTPRPAWPGSSERIARHATGGLHRVRCGPKAEAKASTPSIFSIPRRRRDAARPSRENPLNAGEYLLHLRLACVRVFVLCATSDRTSGRPPGSFVVVVAAQWWLKLSEHVA